MNALALVGGRDYYSLFLVVSVTHDLEESPETNATDLNALPTADLPTAVTEASHKGARRSHNPS